MTNPYPGVAPLVTLRLAGNLPGAGAWDAAPLELPCIGYRTLTLYVTYTRGAAGGAVDFQSQASPYSVDQAGVQNWFSQSVHQAGAVLGGADVQSRIQRDFITYASTGVGAETFVYQGELAAGVERIRVRCRESGGGAVGACHIVGLFGVGV